MAQVLGTGPVHCYLSVDAADTPIYYGTTREGPDITEMISHYPVMNDLTGPALSIDDGYAGREDIITLVMTRWLESLDLLLGAYPNSGGAGPTPGTTDLSMLGTMVVAEGKTIGMWLVNAGAGRASNVAAGMPLGRKYHHCELIGPNKPVIGLKENMKIRIFKAKNILDIGEETLELFSEDPSEFSSLPAIS